MTKSYYEGHEIAYQNIEAKGGNAWRCADFDQHQIRDFVMGALDRIGFADGTGRRCLVIGVGTGPMACELARLGFEVHGIDISETAIKMADQQAIERGLTITYRVGDICKDDFGTERYDLILDSHCMHCIVTDAHREAAFTAVHRALKPNGFMVLHTMLLGTAYGMYGGPIDEDGTLWMKLNEQTGFEYVEAVQREDGWYAPTRRLIKDEDTLNRSLNQFGFTVTWSQTVHEASTGLNDYEGICQRR